MSNPHDHAYDPDLDAFMQEPVDERAPFTRRAFLATTGVVAVGLSLPSREAEAAEPTDALAPGAILRIHPAIGVARVGNASADQFFVGSEVPGYAPI